MNLRKYLPSFFFSSVLAFYLSLGVIYTSTITYSYSRYLPTLAALAIVVLIGCMGGLMLKNKITHAYAVTITVALYTAMLVDLLVWLRWIHVTLIISTLIALCMVMIALFKTFFALKQLSLLQKILIAGSMWVVLFFVCRIVALYFMRVFG